MATLFDIAVANREQDWRNLRVPEIDIAFSRTSGIDARDVQWLRKFSESGYALVMRCPKPGARLFHGIVPPKGQAVKKKSGEFGFGAIEEGEALMKMNKTTGKLEIAKIAEHYLAFVSDYDMMSVWKRVGTRWEKIFMSAANGAPRGPFEPEAKMIVRMLNLKLVSRIQHGCQDDFHSIDNPGVEMGKDHFATFENGTATHFADFVQCKQYYGNTFGWLTDGNRPNDRRARGWFYNATGKFDDTLVEESLRGTRRG